MSLSGWVVRPVLVIALLIAGIFLIDGEASAHPLGNFSVNHYHGLHLHPDRVDLRSVVDVAEIPTLQENLRNRDARQWCDELSRTDRSTVDGRQISWTLSSSAKEHPAGQADLSTTRLVCEFTARVDLARPARLEFRDESNGDRVGWREITAAGTGIRLADSPVPTESVSDELRAYPEDLLSNPMDVRAVAFTAEPGSGSEPKKASGSPVQSFSVTAARLNDILGSDDLTPWLGFLALLLSLLLGASHAALPGHGKTLIAAYLAGRQGTPKDAFIVGASVTATHTGGVLVLGLVISASSALAGEQVLRWLGLVSGLLITVIGVVLLRSALTTTREPALVGAAHGHGHGHGHGYSRASLIGMGAANGLVPSPSALVVLLGAMALGRTWFGVLLVLGYGIGMAGTLTAVGLLLVKARERVERILDGRATRALSHYAPVGTATMVIVVGLWLALQAA
ncbi:nickel/cobalt transporter [Lentzea sp.]|uniref:nickel/cobalt transporter n=1 Tax=Lentzea sp. TaxID=56099 RepID=UPI002C60F5EA|nr:sulfite exporter TauE/SafE family protein [Lentzea sp.]HUQ57808.1 sulfite exporter TauE/SafE family protein [Lentzea sp.]